jgi:hypothetical protein
MACLCGEESRRWTVSELVERLRGLGICATKAGVTAVLAELELELAGWAPWQQVERGYECILAPQVAQKHLGESGEEAPQTRPLVQLCSRAHQKRSLRNRSHRRRITDCRCA